MSEDISQFSIYIDRPTWTSYDPKKEGSYGYHMSSPINKAIENKNNMVLTSWPSNFFNSTTASDFKDLKDIEFSDGIITVTGFLAV